MLLAKLTSRWSHAAGGRHPLSPGRTRARRLTFETGWTAVIDGPGASGAGHLVLVTMTGIFVIGELALAAVAFGNRFRVHAAASAVIMLVFGSLSSSWPAKLEALFAAVPAPLCCTGF